MSKTVMRGGLGVFAVPIVINGNGETSGSTSLNQEGYSQTTQFVATNDSFLTPAGTLSNPFPNGILRPAGASAGAGTFLGQAVTFFDSRAKNPYNVRWNFGIQRQLPGQMVLEVVYIGNHGVHLPVTTQLDYIPRQYLSSSPFRDQTAINLLSGSVANPFKGLLPNSSSLNGSSGASATADPLPAISRSRPSRLHQQWRCDSGQHAWQLLLPEPQRAAAEAAHQRAHADQ